MPARSFRIQFFFPIAVPDAFWIFRCPLFPAGSVISYPNLPRSHVFPCALAAACLRGRRIRSSWITCFGIPASAMRPVRTILCNTSPHTPTALTAHIADRRRLSSRSRTPFDAPSQYQTRPDPVLTDRLAQTARDRARGAAPPLATGCAERHGAWLAARRSRVEFRVKAASTYILPHLG